MSILQYTGAKENGLYDPELEKSVEKAISVPVLVAKNMASVSEVLRTLITMLAVWDKGTWEHSLRVTYLVMKLAEESALRPKEKKDLYIGALLHDIGKIGIPDHIMHKPAALTSAEYLVMKCHAEIGARLLIPTKGFHSSIPMVLYHHERFDGKGYPHGLKGEEILPAVRMLTIADAFEAMISDRPYRKALDLEEAVAEIECQLGKQFDPDLGRIFIRIVDTIGVKWLDEI